MKYLIMVKVWITKKDAYRDYTYEEFDGVEYSTEEEAEEAAEKEFLGEYYIAEKEI